MEIFVHRKIKQLSTFIEEFPQNMESENLTKNSKYSTILSSSKNLRGEKYNEKKSSLLLHSSSRNGTRSKLFSL